MRGTAGADHALCRQAGVGDAGHERPRRIARRFERFAAARGHAVAAERALARARLEARQAVGVAQQHLLWACAHASIAARARREELRF